MKCTLCDNAIEIAPDGVFPEGWNYHHSSFERLQDARGDLFLCPTCSPTLAYPIGARTTPYKN